MRAFSFLVLALLLAGNGLAVEICPLDLKPFVTNSPFRQIGGGYLVPVGQHVMDGVPFNVAGVITLFAKNGAQSMRPGRTNVNDIPVGQPFERLHLLATSHSSGGERAEMARVLLNYTDGTKAALPIRYGEHLRTWFGPWHKTEAPLGDPTAREVWHALCSAAATTDDYLRAFHLTLTNPSPTKVVATISLESAIETRAGLMVLALSVGPADAAPLPNTFPVTTNPFPDLRPRNGDLVAGSGRVVTVDLAPITNALVRVVGARTFSQNFFESAISDPAVGVEATTDADGRFVLPPLPDNKVYRLLVAAAGFEDAPYGGIDPKSDPVVIALSPPPTNRAKLFTVRARIVGPDGAPVGRVAVEPRGATYGLPEQLFSDTNGDLVLSQTNAFRSLQLFIHTKGFAPALETLQATDAIQTIQLGAGSVVRGRLVKDGKPLPGLQVALAASDSFGQRDYAGHYDATTDQDGVFMFEHLPRFRGWYLYGVMSSLKDLGASPTRTIESANHNHTNDVGDLELSPGIRLSGRVETADGDPLPDKLKLRLALTPTADSQFIEVTDDGRFTSAPIWPGSVVSLNLRQYGWRLSGRNRSLDISGSTQIIGQLMNEKPDLVLQIEHGEASYRNAYDPGNGQLPPADWPQSRPLAGAEPVGPAAIVLAGTILDDETGQPLSNCEIIPGYKPAASAGTVRTPPKGTLQTFVDQFKDQPVPFNERPYWAYGHATVVTNGHFSTEFPVVSSTPMLRITAGGYVPFESEPTAVSRTNFIIRLKPGTGPNGVVLLPDGRPAAGAIIAYAASMEYIILDRQQLRFPGLPTKWNQTTTNDGQFTFAVRPYGMKLIVAHPAGWAEQPVPHGGDKLKLRLKPWATVIGTLVDTNGVPVAGENLLITIPGDQQRQPALQVSSRATTDTLGRFVISNLPPCRLDLQRMVTMGAGRYTLRLQTWLVPSPGTNSLGPVTLDTPPPPPMLEQLKQKLGL